MNHVQDCFAEPGAEKQDALINYLLEYEHWTYSLPTSPKVVHETETNAYPARRPDNHDSGHVVNESAVGRVRLNSEGEPVAISVLPASGGEVRFLSPKPR